MGKAADKAYLRGKIRDSSLTKLNLRCLLDIQVRNTQEQLLIEARDLGEGTDYSIDLGAIGT